jgi:hypothetical protein
VVGEYNSARSALYVVPIVTDPDRDLLVAFWVTPESAPDGYGVTAYSLDDAISLLTAAGLDVSGRFSFVENVQAADLDAGHVVPNMGVLVRRGVWYPNLNS